MNLKIEKAYKCKKNNCKSVLMKEALLIIEGEKEKSKNIIRLNDDVLIAVSLSPNKCGNIRQLYENTDFFVTYSMLYHDWFFCDCDDMNVSKISNRISPKDGKKAFDGKIDFDKMERLC